MVNFWSSNHILEIYNFGFFVFVLTIQSFFVKKLSIRKTVKNGFLQTDGYFCSSCYGGHFTWFITWYSIFFFKIYLSFILYNFLCPPIFFWLLVEAEIFVQAAKPICGPDCNDTFSFKECYNHCVELGYKNGFCILSEPVRYRCCCPSKWSNMLSKSFRKNVLCSLNLKNYGSVTFVMGWSNKSMNNKYVVICDINKMRTYFNLYLAFR